MCSSDLSNTIGWTTANIEPAFAQANSASSNTIYLQDVNDTQNTSITSISTVANYASSNTIYLQSVNDVQNSSISSVNLLAQQVFNVANSNLLYVSGIDATQNNRLVAVEANAQYLLGALTQTNTNIISANTQLKSYVDEIGRAHV